MHIFLDKHNIDYKLQSSDVKLETADIAKEAVLDLPGNKLWTVITLYAGRGAPLSK